MYVYNVGENPKILYLTKQPFKALIKLTEFRLGILHCSVCSVFIPKHQEIG